MDIANDMVDVFPIDNKFRVTALHETVLQLFHRTVFYVNSLYLRTRYHTVAHLGVRKVEGVMEYLHLVLNLVFVFGIVDARLHQIVEINLREFLILLFLGNPDAEQTHHPTRELGGKPRDGIKHHIAYPCRYGKESQHCIGI